MKTIFSVLAIAVLGLGFSGCADKDAKKEDTAPVKQSPTMTDAEAVVGTYASGQIRFKANAEGKFSFDMPEKCAAPPCKVSRKMGAYELKRGKLYLNHDGATHVWDYKFTFDPRTMTISKDGQSWTLKHAQ